MNEFGIDTGTSTVSGWTCPNCGAVVPHGELHVCGDRANIGPAAGVWGLAEEPLSPRTYPSLSGTSVAGYWTCHRCGAVVPTGELHVCGGRGDSNSWTPDPDYSSRYPNADVLEARRVRALERIADALEKLAQGNG